MKPKSTFLLLATSLSLFYVKANNTNSLSFTSLATSSTVLHGDHSANATGIKRDKYNKKTTFVSDISGSWKLYAGPSIDKIDRTKPILTGKGKGNFPLNISANQRYYFELVSSDETILLADKHLPMQGGFNFRDLGGYQTTEGRTVKWGKIFRSDDLSNLTTDDLTYLSSIPLTAVLDFRSEQEIKAAPDRTPESVRRDIKLPITPGNLNNLTDLSGDDLDEAMMEMNRLLVNDPASIKQYRKMFDILQNSEGSQTLLYHCTAGKDRTGMATALILSVLGVDQQVIMDDYLLSSEYIQEKFADYLREKPQLQSLFTVKKEFLQAGMDSILKENGSIENFLVNRLNVDIPKFRTLYLD